MNVAGINLNVLQNNSTQGNLTQTNASVISPELMAERIEKLVYGSMSLIGGLFGALGYYGNSTQVTLIPLTFGAMGVLGISGYFKNNDALKKLDEQGKHAADLSFHNVMQLAKSDPIYAATSIAHLALTAYAVFDAVERGDYEGVGLSLLGSFLFNLGKASSTTHKAAQAIFAKLGLYPVLGFVLISPLLPRHETLYLEKQYNDFTDIFYRCTTKKGFTDCVPIKSKVNGTWYKYVTPKSIDYEYLVKNGARKISFENLLKRIP